MKCKIFIGTWYEAQDAFNNWAKGKALTKEVLIHEHVWYKGLDYKEPCLMIIVYHPEDPQWDKTETESPITIPAQRTPSVVSPAEAVAQ